MARENNVTWFCRKMVGRDYWNHSYTHFDADLQVISTNNSTAQPVPRYHQSVGGNNLVLENLIWSISQNRDQALLMLHQHIQGILLGIKNNKIQILF